MKLFVSVGECMLELSAATGDLWRLGVAGDTLNTAWYARAALGPEWEVSYVTRLGLDPFSDRAADFIASGGISTWHISRHPARSVGLYAISLTAGERSFAYWRDTSAARTLMEAPALVETALAAADVIHLSGITLAILPEPARQDLIALVARQRQRGALCALDPNFRARLWSDADTARRVIEAAARAVSVVLPGFEDEAALFGDKDPEVTAARYLGLGAGLVVVKNGAEGVALGQDRIRTFRDLPRAAAVDTTGAGDSFNGTFLAALVGGQGAQAAIRAAHAMAARVVTHRGALIPMEDLTSGHGLGAGDLDQ